MHTSPPPPAAYTPSVRLLWHSIQRISIVDVRGDGWWSRAAASWHVLVAVPTSANIGFDVCPNTHTLTQQLSYNTQNNTTINIIEEGSKYSTIYFVGGVDFHTKINLLGGKYIWHLLVAHLPLNLLLHATINKG